MFWFKKMVIILISPLTVLFGVLALALVLKWRDIGGRWPGRIVVAACAGLLLVSIGPTGELMLSPIENRYEVIEDGAQIEGTTHVVVLGGGYTHRDDGLVTSELADASIVRLNEGIRLHRAVEGSRLVVSGDSVTQPGTIAEAMAELAISMGVDEASIDVLSTARDTGEEAAAVDGITDEDSRVVVVTSASHMPRAMLLFERQGIDATAAPTQHMTTEAPFFRRSLWPAAENIRRVERAVYEYVGLLWVMVGGS